MEEQYLPSSEVYVAEQQGIILGFVALLKNHIAAIFVVKERQGQGVGSLLMDYVKSIRVELTLNVYQKNEKSVKFYSGQDFEIVAETVDQTTGEKEFSMKWNNI